MYRRIIIWCVILQICACFIVALMVACLDGPDYTTSHGVDIYTLGIADITYDIMDDAIEYYVVNFANMSGIDESKIRRMLRDVNIYWVDAPIDCIYHQDGELVNGKCSGLYKYHRIWVVWFGSVSDSALFHELTHRICYEMYGMDDYEHLIYTWLWNIEIMLTSGYGY